MIRASRIRAAFPARSRPVARAAALLLTAAALAGPSAPLPLAAHPRPAPSGPGSAAGADSVAGPGPAARPEAECHTRIRGSRATADCYNGNAAPDRVQLHLRCARWWDPAMDTAPVAVGPTRHVTLTQRCWLRIREAWVSHTPD